MGLDVSAFRPVQLLQEDTDVISSSDMVACAGGTVKLLVEPVFSLRAPEIVHGGVYRYEMHLHHYMGAYSSYNRWREQLCALVGYTTPAAWAARLNPSTPFLELVNFSDCQGVLGAACCRRLAAAFAAYQGAAVRHSDAEFRARYNAFRQMTEFASLEGVICFH
jgi:hypothetical protein